VSLSARACVLVVYAFSPTFIAATIALVFVGAAYIGVLSGMATVVQLRAPAELRGRIASLYFVALGCVYPIGGAVQGKLAGTFGLRSVHAGGAIVLCVALVLIVVARPAWLRSLDDPEVLQWTPTAAE